VVSQLYCPVCTVCPVPSCIDLDPIGLSCTIWRLAVFQEAGSAALKHERSLAATDDRLLLTGAG
jgi:hypothetical protein